MVDELSHQDEQGQRHHDEVRPLLPRVQPDLRRGLGEPGEEVQPHDSHGRHGEGDRHADRDEGEERGKSGKSEKNGIHHPLRSRWTESQANRTNWSVMTTPTTAMKAASGQCGKSRCSALSLTAIIWGTRLNI